MDRKRSESERDRRAELGREGATGSRTAAGGEGEGAGDAGSRGQGKGCLFPFFTSITDAQAVSAERMQVFQVKKGKSRLSDRVT